MGIAFDATSMGSLAASPSTHAHTTSGSDRVLIVFAWGNTTSATGVTYNSVAMTKIADFGDGINTYLGNLWYLVAPATGSNNVTVSGSSGSFRAAAISYTGCSQTGIPDNSTTGNNTSSSITLNLTTVADNCWTILAVASGQVPAAGSGTTGRQTGNTNFIGDSNGAKTPAGSTSLQATMTSGRNFAVMISLAPVAAPSGPTNLKSLDTNVKANIKSYNGNLLANIKSIAGNA